MNRRHILILACIYLFAVGIAGSVLGPAVDDLAEHTKSSLSELAALSTATALGGLAATLIMGPQVDRFGPRRVLLIAAAIYLPAVICVMGSPYLYPLLAFALVMGFGSGTMDLTSNVMVAEVYTGANVSVLNLLHVFFGIGSVVGPALASLSLRLFDNAIPSMLVAWVVILAAVPLAWRMKTGPLFHPAETEPETADQPETVVNSETTLSFYRAPLLWALGLLMLLYVGVEIAIGFWNTAYLERSTSLTEETTALVTSAYWLALTFGRVAGVIWGDRFARQTVLWASLSGSLVGGVLMAIGTGSIALSIAGVVVAGFCFGPVFPTIISITTDVFRHAPGRATSLVVAMGSLGGSTLPWVQGQLLDNISHASSVIFDAVGILAMILVYAAIRATRTRRTELETPHGA